MRVERLQNTLLPSCDEYDAQDGQLRVPLARIINAHPRIFRAGISADKVGMNSIESQKRNKKMHLRILCSTYESISNVSCVDYFRSSLALLLVGPMYTIRQTEP